MHNIKDIRDNIDNFIQLISKRNIKLENNNIIDLDQKNRKLIQEKENLEKEKKKISKTKNNFLKNLKKYL